VSSATNQIVIVDGINFTTTGLPKSVQERERFFVVLAQKLRDKGWTVPAPISEALCATARDCLGFIVQESHAPYVLRLTGEGNLKVGYTIHLQLYSAATKHSQRTNTFCEICVTDGIATSTADLALGLLADAARDDAVTAKDSQKPDSPGLPPSTVGKGELVSPPASSEPRRLSWLPWSMIGVGAVGLGVGAWILHEDGKSSGSARVDANAEPGMPLVLRDHHTSKTMGVITLVAAGAVAAGGILWLALTPSGTATVALSPNQVALTVRY
jgi:hypothetical protein